MVSAWFRLLTVQASWNYIRLVGVGVAYSSEPLLRDLPGGIGGDRYHKALARAAKYFNGHPFLIGLAVGAMARVEHDGVPDEQTGRLRTALAGPLGSVGDKIVWAGALPVASAIGLILAVLVSPLVGVGAFVLLYNSANMALRIWALGTGWNGGMNVGKQLGGRALKLSMRVAGPTAALASGLALPLVGAWLTRGLDANALIGVGLVAAVGVAFARWVWPTLGGLRFGLGFVLFAILAGWL
jgi:mannose/fructose/N-acetylgalactosamine-specific phosphotransferase system component IID